jgi:hypothetical protein
VEPHFACWYVATEPEQDEVVQTLAVQLCPDAHVPHEVTVRLVPQLSEPVTVPQVFPSREQNAASVSGVQVVVVGMRSMKGSPRRSSPTCSFRVLSSPASE